MQKIWEDTNLQLTKYIYQERRQNEDAAMSCNNTSRSPRNPLNDRQLNAEQLFHVGN